MSLAVTNEPGRKLWADNPIPDNPPLSNLWFEMSFLRYGISFLFSVGLFSADFYSKILIGKLEHILKNWNDWQPNLPSSVHDLCRTRKKLSRPNCPLVCPSLVGVISSSSDAFRKSWYAKHTVSTCKIAGITYNTELLMQMNCNIHIYILMLISICDKEPISWLKYHWFKVWVRLINF